MLDITIVIFFLVLNLVIGFLSAKGIANFSEYSVWKRSFGAFAICATLSASFIGGGYVLGNASKVYAVGMIYAFGLLGFSLKEILIATLVAPRMKKYNDCHSVGDMMGKHYGRRIQIITGVFSVLICTGILGAQVSAIAAIFSTFFHMSQSVGIILGFGVMVVYASLGGMRSVVYTDILQFLTLIIGIPLAFILGLHHIGGWHTVTQHVPASSINPFLSEHGIWPLGALVLTFILGEILVPPYVQRLFMAKSTSQTVKATFAAGIISVPIFLLAGATGLIAYVMNAHLNPNLALPYVVQQAVPIGLKGLIVAGLLSVVMSSAAGFLNAIAISFTNDIVIKGFPNKNFSHQTILKLARFIAVISGIGALVFALSIKNILNILIYAYNLWSPIILVPLLAVIFGLQPKNWQFYLTAISGLVFTLIWVLILHDPLHLSGNVVGVLVSFVVFCLSYLGKRDDKLIKH